MLVYTNIVERSALHLAVRPLLMHMAAQHNIVAFVVAVLGTMHKQQLTVRHRVLHRGETHLEHGTWGTVVVATDEVLGAMKQAKDVRTRRSGVEGEISEVVHRIFGRDNGVPPADKFLVHLRHGREGAPAVFDDVGVPEVMVGGEPSIHCGPLVYYLVVTVTSGGVAWV
jgi:hypothetical protein